MGNKSNKLKVVYGYRNSNWKKNKVFFAFRYTVF